MSCRLPARARGWRKALVGRVADRRNHQDRIRSGRSDSGRQLQLRWASVSQERSGPIKSATRGLATRPVCSGSTQPLSFRRRQVSMAPRLSRRFACPAVTSGTSPCRERFSSRCGGSSPVQGRSDQRVQSDPVSGRRHRVFRDDDVRPPLRIRPGHEHPAAARDPARHQDGLVTRSAATATCSILEARPTSDHRVCGACQCQPFGLHLRRQWPSRARRRSPGLQSRWRPSRGLLDRGRGIEAENIARALLARVESIAGRDALEVADVLDLLGRAVRRSSKVREEEKRAVAERAVAIRERAAWSRSSGSGDEPAQSWRPADAGRRSRSQPDRCSSGRWPFEKPHSVRITCWSPGRCRASQGC